MEFEDFINEKKVIEGQVDSQKAKSLIKMSQENLNALESIELNEQTASIILSQSYESLRQVLEAITIMDGYKVYSHEAYTAYLNKIEEFSISRKFNRLRKLRNGINYYAKPVSKNTAHDAFYEITELTKVLIKKYLENLF